MSCTSYLDDGERRVAGNLAVTVRKGNVFSQDRVGSSLVNHLRCTSTGPRHMLWSSWWPLRAPPGQLGGLAWLIVTGLTAACGMLQQSFGRLPARRGRRCVVSDDQPL